MGLRVLYLTAIPSGLNQDAFRGTKLAGQLPGSGGDLLVRHWLTNSRDDAIARNRALAADATDRAEFQAFAPDVVFLEGGLYSDGEDWRIPPDIAVQFVENGGVFLVADVDRNEMMQNYASYAGDLRFFGAELDGYPKDRTQIRYVRDETANTGHPSNILCPWPSNDWDWPKEAYDGVDSVLAITLVALQPRGRALLWSAPTAAVLSQDYYVHQGRTTALATAAQHGLGYAAMVAAAVSPDVVTNVSPGNIRWMCNVAAVLHERATRELGLRRSGPSTSRPGQRGPYGERPAADLAKLAEDKFLEHKQTFEFNIETKKKDVALSDSVLDRVCGFWNAEGGTLLVGIEDRTGRVVGLDGDVRLSKDFDGLVRKITDKLHEDFPGAAPSINVTIETVGDKPVLRIDVPKGDVRLYRRDRFLVRENNTTRELKGEALQEYLHRRWRYSN